MIMTGIALLLLVIQRVFGYSNNIPGYLCCNGLHCLRA